MKQIELTESIQMLQSKVQELEALIEHQKSSMAVVIDIPQNQQALILPDLCRLQQENTELSEKLIEYQTQLEYSKSREKTVIQLVEVLRNNAPNIEIEISNAIKQYQEQVEDKYVLDIKELTETYEAEKRTLIQELEKFTESYRIIKKSDSGNQTFDACPQTHEKSAQTESNELHSLAEVNNSPVIESIGPAVSSVDLQRLLDTELLRNQRARERILELESTLEAQRSSFRKHLEREKDLALTDMDLVPTSESEVESITTSPSVIPHSEQISNDIIQAKHNIDQYVDENVIKESSNIKSSAFPSSENYLPDWYFEVLKKLRQRVYDLEHALTQQNLEKYAPTDAAREEIEKIKSSYEDALRNIQSALEEQTQLAKDQIERLEEYVRISRLEVQSSEHEISSTHALVDQYKHKLLTQEKAHAEELQRVWSQFQKYRTAQDLLTSSLETEIRAYVEIEKRFPIESLELREITTLCNTKRSSLQAVLNGLVVLQANTASEGNHDSELRSFREELLEARLLSYERKVVKISF